MLILISYYYAIVGRKIAILFYIICAFSLIVFNLNYFYPYDFKEDLVKEDAIALKDSLISFSTRSESLIEMEPKALKDDVKLRNLKNDVLSEVRNQGGYSTNAKSKVSQINTILQQYQIPIINPSMAKVNSDKIKGDILEQEINDKIKSFRLKTSAQGTNLEIFDAYSKCKNELASLKEKYVPILEFIINDTTKIDISNDKKNIENNPENIAKISQIVSEINSATKPVNEIKKDDSPFAVLEATITKLGSIGHTLPSIVKHIRKGTKEQKVGAWKNILICLLIDLIVPIAIYVMVRRKDNDKENDTGGGIKVFGPKTPGTW
jgi:hypothetical protein